MLSAKRRHKLFDVAVLILLASAGTGALTTTDVEEVHNPAGFQRVQTDNDMQQLYKDNLDVDMAYWRGKGSLLTSSHFQHQLRQMRSLKVSDYAAVVAIRGNQVWLPLCMRGMQEQPFSCNGHWRVHQVISMLRDGVKQYNLTYPDTVFLLNMWDKPECKEGQNCAVPVMSPFKELGDNDLLIPPLFTSWHYGDMPLYNYPWHLKIPKAFMRANLYQCRDKKFGVCARYYLAHLGERGNHSDVLDAALPNGYVARIRHGKTTDHQGIKYSLPKAEHVELRDHARYKYLINTDGTVASWRLAKIMHCNSPVLKQASNWIEWYYRSLKPGVHYMEFWKEDRDDIFDVIKLLQAKDDLAQQMAGHAQRFAFKYTHVLPKLLYFRQVLLQYNALFDASLSRLVAALPHSRMELGQMMDLAEQCSRSSSCSMSHLRQDPSPA